MNTFNQNRCRRQIPRVCPLPAGRGRSAVFGWLVAGNQAAFGKTTALVLFLLLPLTIAWESASGIAASPADRRSPVFPAYTAVGERAEDATLRAVAFAPDASPPSALTVVGQPSNPNPMAPHHRNRGGSNEGIASREQTTRHTPHSQLGLAVGDYGTVLRSRDRGRTWQTVPCPTDANLNDVIWIDSRRVVAVGGWITPVTGESHGVVLTSVDGGETFSQLPDQDLPWLDQVKRSSARGNRNLVVSGDWSPIHVTNSFSSRDGGRSWEAARPISFQVDQNAGWTGRGLIGHHIARDQSLLSGGEQVAVGDGGSIWIRQNESNDWTRVRSGNRSTGLAIILDDARQIPWSAIGEETLAEHHIVHLIMVGIDDPSTRRKIRHAAAMLAVGRVDFADNRDAAIGLAGQISPEALAIGGSAEPSDLAARLPVSSARGFHSFESQIQILAQEASIGHVIRFQAASDSSSNGQILLPKVAQLRGDLGADAQAIVAPAIPPSDRITGQMLWGETRGGGENSSMRRFTDKFSLSDRAHLSVRPVNRSRHRLQIATARASMQHRMIDWIMNANDASVLKNELKAWLVPCDVDDRPRIALAIYQAATDRGMTRDFETKLLQAIADQLPDEPIGRWAHWRGESLLSIEDRSSTMAAWQRDANAGMIAQASHAVAVSPFSMQTSGSGISIGVPSQNIGSRRVVGFTGSRRTHGDDRQVDFRNRSRDNLRWASHPALLAGASHPNEIQDATEVRHATETDQTWDADHGQSDIHFLAQDPAWKHLVKPDRNSLAGTFFDRRPNLDGRLDEWPAVLRDRLLKSRSTDASLGGQSSNDDPLDDRYQVADSSKLILGWDHEFVYVAGRVSGNDFQPQAASVTRDAANKRLPRWLLQINRDRDFVTSHDFVVDGRGQTLDGIAGDATSDPNWFYAWAKPSAEEAPSAKEASGDWIFEAAIEIDSLGWEPIQSGDHGFVSSRMLIPGEGVRSPWIPNPADWRLVTFQ